MIRVEILDSSPVFLCGLAQLLPRDGIEIVGMRSAPYEEFTFTADVYLVDTSSLQTLGTEAICYVSEAVQHCAVLLLTPTGDVPVQLYLVAGAAGSVSKQADADTMARAIRVAAGLLGDLRELPSEHGGRTSDGKGESTLSHREEQVLEQIAYGYTHSQIARRLGISQHTVNTYVKRIRAKLSLGNKAELARAAVLRRYLPATYPSEQQAQEGRRYG
jgi:DNA-binding NarL/FixJ family response regulator